MKNKQLTNRGQPRDEGCRLPVGMRWQQIAGETTQILAPKREDSSDSTLDEIEKEECFTLVCFLKEEGNASSGSSCPSLSLSLRQFWQSQEENWHKSPDRRHAEV